MAGRTIKIGTGPRAGQTFDVDKPPAAPGGTDPETGKVESVDQAVERMAGTPTNAGAQAQSTDHMNQY
jgi:hypothetical protein